MLAELVVVRLAASTTAKAPGLAELHVVVVVPFSYNWFVEDIFQSPTGYYATVIYKCVYRIHASFSKRYAGQTITTELLKEHFGEVLATGT